MIRRHFNKHSTHRHFYKQTSKAHSPNIDNSRSNWRPFSKPSTIELDIGDGQPEQARGIHVTYTNDPIEAEAWLRNNVIDLYTTALGLDIEWKPQFIKKKLGGKENKTAVLQLSTVTATLVLHIIHLRTLPRYLAEVLADQNVLKVGCGIRPDVIKLLKDTGLQCKGVVDLVALASKSGYTKQHGQGLKKLALNVLGIELNKPKRIQLSNWEVIPLKHNQIEYAALDAWVGIKLFLHMKGKGNNVAITTSEVDGLIDAQPCSTEVVCCSVCGKKCKGQHKLQEHIANAGHTKCPNCGMMFVFCISKKHRNACKGSGGFSAQSSCSRSSDI